MEKKVIFIGGTYREFVRYCLEKGINPHKQVFANHAGPLMGRCLCEECCEIVWGETGPVTHAVSELVAQYIAMGKMHE